MSKNNNCLEGFVCPNCEYTEHFYIRSKSLFEVHDNGTEGHEDVEWDGRSDCRCGSCDHWAPVEDFCLSYVNHDKDKYREAAKKHYSHGGTLEVDPNASVSISDDDGAYVEMQKWITDEEAGVKRSKD